MPDFLVIGAGKSGTTSVDKYLNQHPEIFVPKNKEPNFFGYENMKVEDFDNPEDIRHFQNSVTVLEDYLKIFNDARPYQIKGETSNTYMVHPQAAYRIRYYLPDVKLIAVLRQPTERLYSRYLHLARENRTPSRNFSDCLNRQSIWWRRNDLITEGFYYKNLCPYFELFPRENIKVYLYEDLQDAPLELMHDLYGFLGIDVTFQPDVSLRYNQSGIVRNSFLNRIYDQGGLFSKTLRILLPDTAIQRLKANAGLKRKLLYLRGKNLDKPSLEQGLKRQITSEIYGEDIKQLRTLINRNLDHWLEV